LPHKQDAFVGFLEKEIVKDGIEILDTGENPEAPASREMSDLEVTATRLTLYQRLCQNVPCRISFLL